MKQKIIIKSILTLIVLLLAVPMLFSQVRGNGNVEKQERNVGEFTGIEVRSGIDLIVNQGDQSKLVIEADENLQEYIITEVESGILKIYVQKNTRINRSSAMDAHVTVNQLNKLSVTGGGDVQSHGLISTDDIGISISGGGDLQFDLKATRAKCSVSGGGDVSLDADIRELEAALSGGGDLHFDGDLGLMDLAMSGGGDAKINGGSGADGVMVSMSGGGDLILDIACNKIKVASAGGGDVSANAGSDVSEAGFSLAGGGDLSLAIDVEDLAISVAGGGDASLKGTANKFAGEIKSGGDLDASDFRIKAAKIDLSGGSDARINVEEELLLKASGGSQIHLKGNPHVDANLTGGSKLHRD
jgi:hypothetical protein